MSSPLDTRAAIDIFKDTPLLIAKFYRYGLTLYSKQETGVKFATVCLVLDNIWLFKGLGCC
jgi:hypothetical protein